MAHLVNSVPVLPTGKTNSGPTFYPAKEPSTLTESGSSHLTESTGEFDAEAGPSVVQAPTVNGTPYLELLGPRGKTLYVNDSQSIYVQGIGLVPVKDILMEYGATRPEHPPISPPSARGAAAGLREEEGGLDIPILPDSIDAAIETAIRDAGDAAVNFAKNVAPDAIDPAIDKAAEAIEDAAEGAAEKAGFFKRRTKQEQRANRVIADAEEALLTHPGVYQLGQSFRSAASLTSSAVETVRPANVTVVQPCTIV
jgi:hypothetical protein